MRTASRKALLYFFPLGIKSIYIYIGKEVRIA
jgi:hypothetical protein